MKKHLFLFGVLLYGYSLGVNAQASVRGTVTRSDGEPIIGANVIELGSNNGTVTDLDGSQHTKYGHTVIFDKCFHEHLI